MTPAKAIARLRRLAEDWRHEEARLCEQFGGVVVPQSMRARQIKDTQAIDAAVEMIERLEAAEKELAELRSSMKFRTSLIGRTEAERDDLRAENAGLVDDMNLLRDNNTALRARIEAMGRQEPVGTLHDDGCFVWRETAPHQSNYAGWKMALYALPGVKGE